MARRTDFRDVGGCLLSSQRAAVPAVCEREQLLDRQCWLAA